MREIESMREIDRIYLVSCMLFLSIIFCQPSVAQTADSVNTEQKVKVPRFELSVAGIYSMLETNLRFETLAGLLGININLEEHMGLAKYKLMPVFTGKIHIKNRHSIFGMYYGLPRSSSFLVDESFEFNGEVISINTQIDTYFNLNVGSIGYMYDVIRDEKAHLGLFLNFYYLSLKTGISSDQQLLNEDIWLKAPLPNIGAQTSYRIGKRFGFSGLISLFFLTFDDVSGSMHTLGAQMDYYVSPWLNLGLGYYWFDLNIEAEDTQFTGILDYTYQGPYLQLGFKF